MSVKSVDLGLTGYDELFMSDKERAENRLPKIQDIPISEIDDFPDHPFHVRLDADMDELVQSVKERGIITHITLRQKEDGRYEIVSGHRRRKACELAGLDTVKAEVKDLSRDEAIILMVESNLQRTTILPSEKAFAYKMRLDAMNRQGQRTDLTSRPVGEKLYSVDKMSGEVNDSARQIHRFVRLTNLLPDLLSKVDEGKIAMRPAVELSYLAENEQQSLLDSIESEDCTPSYAQAMKMRRFSQEGNLTDEVILSIMEEEKPNQKEQFKMPKERIARFFPEGTPREKMEDIIIKALELYRKRERQRSMER